MAVKKTLTERDLRSLLGQLYVEHRVPLDQLPYTDDFDSIMRELRGVYDGLKEKVVWRLLMIMRKDGTLPKLTARETHLDNKRRAIETELRRPGLLF